MSRIIAAGDSQILDVGRATRTWSPAQRRAVNARDRGCRGPNCDRPVAWTAIHHLVWWSNGGPTSIDNGLALCHHCHRLIHDHGWTVNLDPDTATATWTSPTGRTIATTPAHHDTPDQAGTPDHAVLSDPSVPPDPAGVEPDDAGSNDGPGIDPGPPGRSGPDEPDPPDPPDVVVQPPRHTTVATAGGNPRP